VNINDNDDNESDDVDDYYNDDEKI